MDHRVEAYIASMEETKDPVLRDLERDAEERSVPIIGPLVGRVISMIARSAGAEKALEIGTATGYSGIWIARSLEGKRKSLRTVEMDPVRQREASKNFKRAKVDKFVEILPGNARDIVHKISEKEKGSFDLVFLDVGEKTLYVDLFKPCVKALRVGGFLIADNTLWGGSVAMKEDDSPETVTLRRFNELVFSDKRLDGAIIPLRDGFTLAYKKNG